MLCFVRGHAALHRRALERLVTRELQIGSRSTMGEGERAEAGAQRSGQLREVLERSAAADGRVRAAGLRSVLTSTDGYRLVPPIAVEASTARSPALPSSSLAVFLQIVMENYETLGTIGEG
jgi:hypothetical protein